MEAENLNRAYLETLTFADLTALADEYGIDVPENLDRRILIGELLELAEELQAVEDESMIISQNKSTEDSLSLPGNYNETQISCVLRNPVWGFVFWNISEADKNMLNGFDDCSLMLRVCSLSSINEPKPEEAFEIQIDKDINEQYILLPKGKQFIRIELVYTTKNTGKVLAFSPVVEIQPGSKYVNDFQPGKDNDFSKIIQLSGMEKILTEQYKNHRHSFS